MAFSVSSHFGMASIPSPDSSKMGHVSSGTTAGTMTIEEPRISLLAHQRLQDDRIQKLQIENENLRATIADLTQASQAAFAAQLKVTSAFEAAILNLNATVAALSGRVQALQAEHDRLLISNLPS